MITSYFDVDIITYPYSKPSAGYTSGAWLNYFVQTRKNRHLPIVYSTICLVMISRHVIFSNQLYPCRDSWKSN